MLDLSELPLRHNNASNNIYEQEFMRENESIVVSRKIEFDRGIPQSFDFELNEVNTISFDILKIFTFYFNRIFYGPLNRLVIFLLLFYYIAYLINPLEVSSFKISLTICVHGVLIILEVFYHLFEFYKIWKNDKKINLQPVKIWDMQQKSFISVTWADIRVGHIIKIMKDEIVPADVIILDTMESNHKCYVDISAINGVFASFEIKHACMDTRTPSIKSIKFTEYVKNIKGILKFEQPNSNLTSFVGRLKLESFPRASEISIENFVMRGSTIKNISFIYGLVVYTGMETKIMQILKSEKKDNYEAKLKQNIMNTSWIRIKYIIVIIYILLIIVLSLSSSQKMQIFESNINSIFNYSLSNEFYYQFIQNLLTFHLMIPFNWFSLTELALYIMEILVKFDVKIIQKSNNSIQILNKNCLPNLGQVSYILTDKTGTLTKRKLILKACSINGKVFSFESLDRSEETNIFESKNTDIHLLEIFNEFESNTKFSVIIKNFFEYLCLCHTVKLSLNNLKRDSGSKLVNNINYNNKDEMRIRRNRNLIDSKDIDNNEIEFRSSFADEKTTLKMLKLFGYCLKKTKADKTIIEVSGESRIYHILGVNKYSEERKRMSIIVKKYRNDPESLLLCKGNDLSILRKIRFSSNEQLLLITDQIKKFSSIGLRFFVFCKKELSEEETHSFKMKYKSTENFMIHRNVHFDRLGNEFEVEMEFLGVLFFEEKVSSDVRHSINKLNQSDIKVWVISGDKKENVLAVSKNLDMHENDTNIVEFSEKDDLDELDIKMKSTLLQCLGTTDNLTKMKTRNGFSLSVDSSFSNIKYSKSKPMTLFIHGSCFNLIYNDIGLYQSFSTLLSFTTNLFAYSFTANNKFTLCRTVKKFLGEHSQILAIGDGLNDLMMLKEADVSVGILSREIIQVRNTCDIIVKKFPQIVELILVHGSWNINRFYVICFYSLYTNVLIIIRFFHYASNVNMVWYNKNNYTKMVIDILIINISITLIVSFDQVVDRRLIGLFPSVYLENFKSRSVILRNFFSYFSKAVIDSIIIFYSFSLVDNYINVIGETIDVHILDYLVLYTSYSVIYLKLFTLKLKAINQISVLILFFSILALISTTIFIYDDDDELLAAYQSLSYLSLILCGFFAVHVCYLYENCIYSIIFFYYPSFLNLIVDKLEKLIEDYLLFLNFDYIQKEISSIDKCSKTENKVTRYQEVVQRIYNDNNNIDAGLLNMMDIDDDKIAMLKIKKPFLKFHDEKLESDYMNHHFSTNIKTNYFCYLVIMVVFWIIDVIIQSVYYKSLKEELITKSLKIVYLIIGFILLSRKFSEYFLNIYSIFYYFGLIIEIFCIYIEKSDNDIKICINFMVFFSYPVFFANRKFKLILYGAIFYVISIIPSVFLNDFQLVIGKLNNDPKFILNNLNLIIHRSIFILAIISLLIIYGYYEELYSRIEFLKFNKKTSDLKKDYEIYNNLVPEFIREKMKNGVRGITAIDYEVVTILFCDLSEFDKFVAMLSPNDLIYLLDKIYNIFDQLCQFHGLQKIETVGKTYMCAGGLKETEKDIDPSTLERHHAIRSFELAKDMISVIKSMIFENGEELKIKIGLHTGKVIAAVVGNHKPQFSLIGDTINTTARMCAYSSDMAINCSEDTYKHISSASYDFICSTREVKGKGKMNLYLYKPEIFKPSSNSLGNEPFLTNKLLIKSPRITTSSRNVLMPRQSGILESRLKNWQVLNNSNDFSVFIYDNSLEMKDKNNSIIQTVQESKNKAKSVLSRTLTNVNYNFINKEKIDKNTIFRNSFFFMRFKSHELYDLYNKFSLNKIKKHEFKAVMINYIYITTMGFSVYQLFEFGKFNTNVLYTFTGSKLFLIISIKLLNDNLIKLRRKNTKLLQIINLIIYIALSIIIQVQLNYWDSYSTINLIMEQNLTILAVSYNGVLNFRQTIISLVSLIVIFLINISINNGKPLIIKYLTHEIAICFGFSIFILIREYVSTFEFLQNKNETEKLKSMEKLLSNLMPQHVVQNMKEDIPVADVIHNVTLLFADIVSFTDYSSQREPVEVVNMLSQLFKDFDDACEKLNVYKVHTIGDCYVVMSFTGKVNMNERNYKEEAKNIVEMGESMIETIKVVRKGVNFEELNMRIGIHTGTVIAGIIGTKVVRYDIFGSDVLIANKMESGGIAGKINISEDTKILLESEETLKSDAIFKFVPNKTISISSVNREINSFYIERNMFFPMNF